MVEATKKPEGESKSAPSIGQVNEIKQAITDAKVHTLGDFGQKDPQKADQIFKELERHYTGLIDTDPHVRLESVNQLGKLLSSKDERFFGHSKVVDASAAYMLASCMKDPASSVRYAAINQLNNIIAKTPISFMAHVVALNSIKMAPKWGKLLSGIKLPNIGKLF